jgi:hypothetical protein
MERTYRRPLGAPVAFLSTVAFLNDLSLRGRVGEINYLRV